MMNRIHTHRQPAAARHWGSRRAAIGAIEWEELPSLTEMLRREDEHHTTRSSVWSATERMDLEMAPAPAPAPFVESIDGLHVREIANDEVFRHFFGVPGANH